MRSSHTFRVDSAKFDDDHLVSSAGLLPVMTLADQSGLTELLAGKVSITTTKVASGAANLAPKLTT
ncbi:MAG: IS1380 family transposase, partial [Rhodococcus sp. (in: high G+C Gram-positive bacteria)]